MVAPVEIYTDGSAIRNPGPAGFGYIIRWYVPKENELPETKELSNSKGFRLSTNSRMEIMGVLEALNEFKTEYRKNTFGDSGQVNVFSDSEYVCNSINKRWIDKWQTNNWMTSGYNGQAPKSVANRDLWEKMLQITGEIRSMGITVTFNWVKGHNGDPMNERCDQLANTAASSQPQAIDEVYESARKSNSSYQSRQGWR